MAISTSIDKIFTRKEEFLNIITSCIGFVASIVGIVVLYLKSSENNVLALMIYSTTMIFVYLSSILAHSVKSRAIKMQMNIIDHIAVDLFIAGTYTSLVVIQLKGELAILILWLAWILCLTSVVFKLLYKEKPQWISEICYFILSVLWLLAYDQISQTFSAESIVLLLGGIVSYLIGLYIFKLEHLPYNHPVFHLFVLLGTTLHFIQIYFYSL